MDNDPNEDNENYFNQIDSKPKSRSSKKLISNPKQKIDIINEINNVENNYLNDTKYPTKKQIQMNNLLR